MKKIAMMVLTLGVVLGFALTASACGGYGPGSGYGPCPAWSSAGSGRGPGGCPGYNGPGSGRGYGRGYGMMRGGTVQPAPVNPGQTAQ